MSAVDIEQRIAATTTWPERRTLHGPERLALDPIYRRLYASLAPDQPPLPVADANDSAISARGDGIFERCEWCWMIGSSEDCWYHLLVADQVHVVVTLHFSDAGTCSDPYTFELRAPTAASADAALAILTDLVANRGR